jgi:uncharacterized membrane protein YqjE
MADQATVTPPGPAKKLGRNVTSFAHDLITLIELQLRLLSVDVRDASQTAGTASALVVVGVLAAIGTIPLLFVTLAAALIEFAHWSHTAAFALVSVLGLMSGAALAYFGWKKLLVAGTTLGRSKAEMVQTLQWVKETLRPKDDDETESRYTRRF